MAKFNFNGKFEEIPDITIRSRPVDDIKNETMLYSASWSFAMDNAGPITREVLRKLSGTALDDVGGIDLEQYPYPIIDTRVHMLMGGMYPAIPGWHCDNVPRIDNGTQPNLDMATERQYNYTVLVSDDTASDVAPTQFISDPLTLYYDPKQVWGTVNKAVQAANPKVINANDGKFYRFDSKVLHRATAAQKRGWRYFFRLSWMHYPPKNEIRRQVQVYADSNIGW